MTVALVLIAGLPSPSGAALLTGAITGVTTSPTPPATTDINGLITTNIAWQVPNGTQAGDTFTLTLPPELIGVPASFQLLDPSNQVVANATRSGGVVTFTMTAYAQSHNNVSGTATFTAHLDTTQVTFGQTVPLKYTTNDNQTFTNPIIIDPLALADSISPHKTGHFDPPNDETQAIKWNIYSQSGVSASTVFTDNINPALAIDCATPFVITIGTPTGVQNGFLAGIPGNPSGAYAGATIVCDTATNSFTVTTGPTVGNQMFLLTVRTLILSQNPNIANTFTNTAEVKTDGSDQSTTGNVTQSSAGGLGNGNVPVPSIQILKDDANGNAADTAAAAVSLPTGGTGLVYTITNNGQESLSTIDVSDAVVTNGTVTGLTCDFSALGGPATGTTWTGPLAVGASFGCTATLSGVTAGTPIHEDNATVTAIGIQSNNPTSDSNEYFADAPPSVSVGDYVWLDTNRDGIQDAAEAGIGGVSLTLTGPTGAAVNDIAGNPVGPTTTAADGSYSFDNLPVLPAGQHYTVTVDTASPALANLLPTMANAGTDTSVDSSTGSADSGDLVNDGDRDPTLDFGFVSTPYAIGDYTWLDSNKNGIQDAGEPALPGVTVALTDASGNPVLDLNGATVNTVVTDANGAYHFDNLPAGSYVVTFTPTPAYVFTGQTVGGNQTVDSNADVVTGKSAVVNLGPADANLTNSVGADGVGAPKIDRTIDAGFVPTTYAIGDFVWTDTNHNGIQDAGEPAVQNVTVTLKDSTGATVGTATSDINGAYHFDNLTPGDYTVIFTAPPGMSFTGQNVGANPAVDSNPDSTGLTAVVHLDPTDTNLTNSTPTDGVAAPKIDRTIDAGLVPTTYAIGDYVWTDTNHNGIQDTGEPAVQNVTVTLKDSTGATVGTATTDINGFYHFDNLTPGNYTVTFTAPPGMSFTTQTAGTDTTLDSNPDATGLTAVINLGPTDTNLTNSVPGDGVTAQKIDRTIDAGLVPTTYAIGDYVWTDTNKNGIQDTGEPAVQNVTVTLKDSTGATVATATTDINGAYHFDNLTPGNYTVTFTAPPGMSFTTQTAGANQGVDSNPDAVTGVTAVINLGPTDTNLTNSTPGDNVTAQKIDRTIDAGLVPTTYAIGDFVWTDTNKNGIQDTGELGVQNVTVTLKDSTGATVATATTSPTGAYHFDNLTPGNYTVTFTAPTGLSFTTPTAGTDQTVDSNPDQSGLSAVVHLGPTDANLTNSAPTDGVTAQKIDRTIDAGLVPTTYAIGDYVWLDNNHNGVQDTGEIPVSGVSVTLKDSAGSTVATATTSATGAYHFDNLTPGDYTVAVTAPSGYSFTSQSTGTDHTVDSNVDSTGLTAVIHLGPTDADLADTVSGDGVAAPKIDRTIDAGLVKSPGNGSVRVEKYDGDNTFTPKATVATADKDTDAPQGDADTAATAIAATSTGTTPVAVTFNNNGDVPLYDVTVIDQTTSGTGTVGGLSCTFPDGSTGLYFVGPLSVGAVVKCTGTLPALGSGASHQDKVTVYGRPGVITAGVAGPNPANPQTGKAIVPGETGTVSDNDLFNVTTPAPATAPTTANNNTTTTTTPQAAANQTSSTTPGGPLAFTGQNMGVLLVLAGALALIGLVLYALARFCRRSSDGRTTV